MKVLGVTFTDTLSISPHVKYLASKSAQISFALRTFRAHGLSGGALWAVSQAHIVSRLTYAAPAWWGFCNMGERDQLQAIVSRLVKRNYLPPNQPPLHDIVATADLRLFNSVCRGSIMVTTSDFQSGRLGSSPSRDHYSMRLDRGTGLIRAFIPPG